MGALAGVFGAVASFPIGTLADRYDRRVVLAGSVLVWSGATVVCGLASDFTVLSAGAIATAVGESAFVAIIYGMIPELFEPRLRPLANTIIYALFTLGVALALYAAGATLGMIDAIKTYWEITASRASWRLAFGLVGALGLPLCALLLLVVPGKHQRLEHLAREGAARESMLRYLLKEGPLVISLLFCLATYRMAASALQFWMPTVLVREFGASPQFAGIALGRAALVGTIVGVVIALILLPRALRTLGAKATPWIAATGCCAAGFTVIALLPTPSAIVSLLLYGSFIALAVITSSITPGLYQDMSPPHLRSRTIALVGILTLAPRSLIYYSIGRYSDSGSGHDLKLSVAVICGAALITAAIGFVFMVRPYKRLLVRLGHGR
jgi:MFS family permease